MLNSLKDINNKLLIKHKNNPEKFEKQLMISNFLKDNKYFFKISIEDAYNILMDLEIANYKDIYVSLISYNDYVK